MSDADIGQYHEERESPLIEAVARELILSGVPIDLQREILDMIREWEWDEANRGVLEWISPIGPDLKRMLESTQPGGS